MNKDVRMKGFSQRTPVDQVFEWLNRLELNSRTETIELDNAHGRVLAEEVVSEVNVPGFRRSMMDGYAVRAAEILGANSYNPIQLTVVGEVLPGQPCSLKTGKGEAVRVMTGAEVPASVDAVIPVEFTKDHDESVTVFASIPEQKNVGKIGEDIRANQAVLAKSRKLRPQDVGLLASIGIKTIRVFAEPTVRIIITGNELLPAGEKPGGVQIVDSNSVMLKALVDRDGGRPDFPGIIPDDKRAITAAMNEPCDVILVAGGSSTGKEDFAPTIVHEQGELCIHGIAMRPSSPAGMGIINKTPIFLLPGNPVSCLCAYDFFPRLIIRKLSGLQPGWPYQKSVLPLAKKITSAIGRTDYARVRVTDQGVEPIAISGASILSSTSQAEGFCIIPQDSEGYPEGTQIEVFLYEPVHN